MRINNLFFLLLAGIILGWAGCDDEDDTSTCEVNLPELTYSDGNCSPDLFTFDDLLGFPSSDGVILPPSCLGANEHGQVIQLTLPPTAEDEVTLHVYNATYGYAYLELFGSNDCGASSVSLSGCFSTTSAAEKFTVSGLNGFTDFFIRIDVAESGPTEPFEEYIPEAGQFIAVAAYGNEPTSAIAEYGGYNPEFQLETISVSCNGRSTQRVILGSCNPDADVFSWLQEVGLTVSESYTGNGGAVTAADVPPGMDPNTTGTVLNKRRPRQDTDDFFAEEDFILRVPVPGGSGLLGAQEADPNFGAALECLNFNLGQGSTEKPEDQIVVTMIDSGVDDTGERFNIFSNHLNRSIDDFFTPVNKFGYDFYFGDDLPEDEFGHGTATAGAMIGSYTGDRPLTVIHNKIFGLDSSGEPLGTYFGAVVATQVAGDIRSDIINMSFGLSPDEEPQALRCAIDYAIANGAIVVASAGNNMLDVDSAPQWPAAFSIVNFPNLVAVASYNYPPGGFPDAEPVLSSFSNFGPGTTNVAAYLTAKTPTWQGLTGEFNYLAGTSISAPLISSALATEQANGGDPFLLIPNLPSSGALIGRVKEGRYLPVCE